MFSSITFHSRSVLEKHFLHAIVAQCNFAMKAKCIHAITKAQHTLYAPSLGTAQAISYRSLLLSKYTALVREKLTKC